MLVGVLPDDAPDPRAVLDAFGLRGELRSVALVDGAWSNRVLMLRTSHGAYAVKQVLNPWGEPAWRDWVEEGWRLERAALAAGVAAPPPVPSPDGGCLIDVPSIDASRTVCVRVHHWVDARPMPREPVDVATARWMGGVLATVHGLALTPVRPELYAGRVGLTTHEVWPDLVARSAAAGAPWAGALADAEPLARRASALLEPWDDSRAVLVHADVDQKNLLVAADGPMICDWDVVVPALASHDLAHAALTMASWRAPLIAAEVIASYRAAGGAVERIAASDLGPALASRLGWVRFTVDRALAARERDGAPTPADDDLVRRALGDLPHRLAVAEDLAGWLP
jgi:Ser/Thr protein kinase RdoA (MazF antagonist)